MIDIDRFNYLLDKINCSEIEDNPFPHISVENFFKSKDFEEIILSKQIGLKTVKSDQELFDELFANGYDIVPFPGAITNYKEYMAWHAGKKNSLEHHSACEAAGIVLRLNKPSTPILNQIKLFINSEEFNLAISKKFNVNLQECNRDSGIQKYLDGYEISPHPDLRKKALTFMVNINPSRDSENATYHTHYLKFTKSKQYVSEYWKGNPMVERCWVPWEWCSTVKQQIKNNSIVIFSPSDCTLHAVKADYQHFNGQRTQLYGNIWYEKKIQESESRLDWWDFDLQTHRENQNKKGLKSIISSVYWRLREDKNKVDKSRRDNY